MITALIFAGGTGQRMNSNSVPKQFLEYKGKPIIIYTLEKFQDNPSVDGIVVVCLESWIDRCRELIDQFSISKVKAIVPGGASGQESIRLGLEKLGELYDGDDIVLVHDGVRPLVDEDTINKTIGSVKAHGNAITVVPAIETITMADESGCIESIIDRSKCQMARAPQGFLIGDLMECHRKACEDELEFIDCASMAKHYGFKLFTVQGNTTNIKITTPIDFAVFKALVDEEQA